MTLDQFCKKLRNAGWQHIDKRVYEHKETGNRFGCLDAIRLNAPLAERWTYYATRDIIPPANFITYGEWIKGMAAEGWTRGERDPIQLKLFSGAWNAGKWRDTHGREMDEETAVNYYLNAIIPPVIPF